MNFVIDTHSLFWYLIADKKLSQRAKTGLDAASKIYIPTIVLLELYYLMKKNQIEQEFPGFLKRIRAGKKYIIVSDDLGIVENLTKFKFDLEIHDNIIATTAKVLNLPLVTKDPQIKKVYKNTIW